MEDRLIDLIYEEELAEFELEYADALDEQAKEDYERHLFNTGQCDCGACNYCLCCPL